MIRGLCGLGVAGATFEGLAQALPVPLEGLLGELGMGASLLIAFWLIVKDFRKQDALQAKAIAEMYEKTSQAERRAWDAQTRNLLLRVDQLGSVMTDVEDAVYDIKRIVGALED